MLDFEQIWLSKLSASLEKIRDSEFCKRMMKGSEKFSGETPPEQIIAWTSELITRLNSQLTPEEVNEVITRCACHYPPAKLFPIRDVFRINHSFPEALRMLEEQFVSTLSEGMMIEREIVDKLLSLGMGPAGILEENRIVATKIPKSKNIRAWIASEDPVERKALYCHCPRVLKAYALEMSVPGEYCLCGAGFYRNIWETITEAPVRVEVIESILDGHDVCRIAIYPAALKG